MLRVVVDANIWISALLNSRKALAVVSLLEHDQFELICADTLIDELVVVLNRPKFSTKIKSGRRETLLELVREKARFVELPAVIDEICRDPKDDAYIICAVVAQAEYLVSGDKDLLVLKEHEGVKIVSLPTFVELFEKKLSRESNG